MNNTIITGTVILFLGLMGFAVPIFTTQSDKDVANIGDLHIQTTQSTSHTISPYLSGGAVLLGLIVIGGGLRRRA